MYGLSIVLAGLPLALACVFAWQYRDVVRSVGEACKTLDGVKRALLGSPPTVEDLSRAILASLDGSGRAAARTDPVASSVRDLVEARRSGFAPDIDESAGQAIAAVLSQRRRLGRTVPALLVSGLLGTLIGLSVSLWRLGPMATAPEPDLNKALGGISTALTVAFLPSITGVAATLVGVLALAVFDARFGERLEREVRRVVVLSLAPKLFPTPSRAFLEALAEGQRLSRESIDSASKVNALAKDLGGRFDELIPSIDKTRAQLEGLDSDAARFSDATRRLADAAVQLSGLRRDVTAAFKAIHLLTKDAAGRLTDHLLESRRLLGDQAEAVKGQLASQQRESHDLLEGQTSRVLGTLRASLEAQGETANRIGGDVKTLHETLERQLSAQRTGLDGVLESLRKYETAYVEGRAEMEARVSALVKTGERTLEGLDKWDQDVVERIIAPLHEVQVSFARLDPPLVEAAASLRRTAVVLLQRDEDQRERLMSELVALRRAIEQLGGRPRPHAVLHPHSEGRSAVSESSRSEVPAGAALPGEGARASLLSLLRRVLFAEWRLWP
jgi:ABC-type transporter Mla subunit MlaD